MQLPGQCLSPSLSLHGCLLGEDAEASQIGMSHGDACSWKQAVMPWRS